MCGRFTLTNPDTAWLTSELGVQFPLFSEIRPRYNIAPGQFHWIVRREQDKRRALLARWWLVNRWAKDRTRAARQINARAETIDQRPAFREAFRHKRCIIPADGFYEWATTSSGKQPYWFQQKDNGLLLFAGLYESWEAQPEHWEPTFTIITTEANATVRPVHDRMPVILTKEMVQEWLSASDVRDLRRFLGPADEELLIAALASKRVNSVNYDDPGCLLP